MIDSEDNNDPRAVKRAALTFVRDRCQRLLARQPDHVFASTLLSLADALPTDRLLAACMRMEHSGRGQDLTGARWGLVEIPIADIVIPNPHHMRAVENEPDYYVDLDLRQPVGLVRLRSGRYFLLDGYHRLAHLLRQDPNLTVPYLATDGWLQTIQTSGPNTLNDESPELAPL